MPVFGEEAEKIVRHETRKQNKENNKKDEVEYEECSFCNDLLQIINVKVVKKCVNCGRVMIIDDTLPYLKKEPEKKEEHIDKEKGV